MMKIGLTGGIGCGKSTAGDFFEEAGFRRSDSDRVVRDLLEKNDEVRQAIREHFGDGVFASNGELDRGALARIVFTQTNELEWLEHLLHPRVTSIWQARVAAEPERCWCVEIPLLFEKNLEKPFDFTVCVSSSEPVQLARLAAKGLTRDQALARIARQLPLDAKVDRADFVILNDGSYDFLRQQVFELIDDLKTLS